MKHLFYELVEMITERITGIENGAIHLWELGTWMEVQDKVTLWCNIGVILAIITISFSIYWMYNIGKIIVNKIKSNCSEARVLG